MNAKIWNAMAAVAVAAALGASALGCHTVKGAGQDIQHGGKAIERAADDAHGK